MCFFKKKPPIVPVEPPEEVPDWVIQSREEVAIEEEEAAAIHYTYMILIEDGDYPDNTAVGSYDHHEHWWIKHQEAAYYIRESK